MDQFVHFTDFATIWLLDPLNRADIRTEYFLILKQTENNKWEKIGFIIPNVGWMLLA